MEVQLAATLKLSTTEDAEDGRKALFWRAGFNLRVLSVHRGRSFVGSCDAVLFI